jgi:hypothetical protein
VVAALDAPSISLRTSCSGSCSKDAVAHRDIMLVIPVKLIMVCSSSGVSQ